MLYSSILRGGPESVLRGLRRVLGGAWSTLRIGRLGRRFCSKRRACAEAAGELCRRELIGVGCAEGKRPEAFPSPPFPCLLNTTRVRSCEIDWREPRTPTKHRRETSKGEVLFGEGDHLRATIPPGTYRLCDLVTYPDFKVIPDVAAFSCTWTSGTPYGTLEAPQDFDGFVPIAIASQDLLSYYGCRMASADLQDMTCVELRARHKIITFHYREDYKENLVLNPRRGAGYLGLEAHDFVHLECPMSADSGHLLLGKLVTEDGDARNEESQSMHLTAFIIPLGHTVYIAPRVVHSNDHMKGLWRTMLGSPENEEPTPEDKIDHVLLMKKSEGEEKPVDLFFGQLQRAHHRRRDAENSRNQKLFERWMSTRRSIPGAVCVPGDAKSLDKQKNFWVGFRKRKRLRRLATRDEVLAIYDRVDRGGNGTRTFSVRRTLLSVESQGEGKAGGEEASGTLLSRRSLQREGSYFSSVYAGRFLGGIDAVTHALRQFHDSTVKRVAAAKRSAFVVYAWAGDTAHNSCMFSRFARQVQLCASNVCRVCFFDCIDACPCGLMTPNT